MMDNTDKIGEEMGQLDPERNTTESERAEHSYRLGNPERNAPTPESEAIAALETLEAAVTSYWEYAATPRKPIPDRTAEALDKARAALARLKGEK